MCTISPAGRLLDHRFRVERVASLGNRQLVVYKSSGRDSSARVLRLVVSSPQGPNNLKELLAQPGLV